LLDKDTGVAMIALWDAFKSTDMADIGAEAKNILPYRWPRRHTRQPRRWRGWRPVWQ
jgi:hypothetical protein